MGKAYGVGAKRLSQGRTIHHRSVRQTHEAIGRSKCRDGFIEATEKTCHCDGASSGRVNRHFDTFQLRAPIHTRGHHSAPPMPRALSTVRGECRSCWCHAHHHSSVTSTRVFLLAAACASHRFFEQKSIRHCTVRHLRNKETGTLEF